MNFLPNSNFTHRGDKTIQSEKPGRILFSGFLVALLGVSGIQTSIPSSFDTLQGGQAVRNDEAAVVPVCQEHPGVEAIIADSTLESVSDKKIADQEQSPECQQEEKLKQALAEEVAPSEALPNALTEAEQKEEEAYQKKVAELEELLKGYPLAKMSESIAKQDPEIAALIVGIARKESQWGKRSPKKNGDCFNYWGYKGSAGRGTGMGYACFATREEAVEKIATRLEKLVDKRGTSKPSALVTPWKCGNSCATHSPESVRKWVSDVNQYYTKVLAMK